MSAAFYVQAAFAESIGALGIRVHDSAPQATDGGAAAVFPYVEVGAIVFASFDTKTETGFDFVARIHTRSRSGSMKECRLIQGEIYAALHNGALDMPNYNSILLRREMSECTRQANGSFHGVCEYRGLIEYTPDRV